MLTAPALPRSRPLDIAGPLEALRALAGLPYAFLLHSALEGPRARWSFFGADPFAIHRGDYDAVVESFRALAAHAPADAGPDGAPFTGGAVGWWSYDFGRRLERLPSLALDDTALPDFLLGFYDVVGVWDHAKGRGRLYSSGLPLAGPEQHARARHRLDSIAQRLEAVLPPATPPTLSAGPIEAHSTFDPEGYRRAIRQIQHHIERGDLFQANLSQRWTLERPGDGLSLAMPLYVALSRRSPAPYAAFFGAPDHAVVSASPERFLELRGRAVETRPIKGTRPRSENAAEDRRLAAELESSPKDRAENVMIVDVLRNDIGRVCETGSVQVRGLCELEEFPHVFHLTSTVAGQLSSGFDAFDLLHACFPGGSITGAPKIRAMEILEGLEPVRRNLYTGAIGYVGWRGDADWSIAIRTAQASPCWIRFAAGGGITADSDPDAEYQETLDKAEGMRAALGEVVGPVRLQTVSPAAR